MKSKDEFVFERIPNSEGAKRFWHEWNQVLLCLTTSMQKVIQFRLSNSLNHSFYTWCVAKSFGIEYSLFVQKLLADSFLKPCEATKNS